MAQTRSFTVSITSDGAQVGTAYTPWLTGYVEKIQYVKDGGASPYTNGVDFTITSDVTGEGLWTETNVNASTSRTPRQATHTILGAASLFAALGEAVTDRIALARDRVKIVLAQAGAAKVGSFVVTVSDR